MESHSVVRKRNEGRHEVEFLDTKTAVLKWYVEIPELIAFLKKTGGASFEISNLEIVADLRKQAKDPETEKLLRTNIEGLLTHCGRLKPGLLKKIWS